MKRTLAAATMAFAAGSIAGLMLGLLVAFWLPGLAGGAPEGPTWVVVEFTTVAGLGMAGITALVSGFWA